MKIKLFSASLFFALIMSISGCSDHVVADFVYSPEDPVTGQTVTFTNTSTGDENWKLKSLNWDFGDDYKSTSTAPTHIYRKPGVYTVTMKVDSNKNYVVSKPITVYDSVPTIYIADSIKYYKKVLIKALVYNPFNEDVTYSWTFSGNVKGDSIVDGKSTAKEFYAYFTKITKENEYEMIKLKVTVGDKTYDLPETPFRVYNYKTRSLLMAQKDGDILRQRIYDLGIDAPEITNLPSGKHGLSFVSYGNYAYLFDAGSVVSPTASGTGDGSVKVIDLTNNQMSTVVTNSSTTASHTFYTGSVDKDNIYWTDFQNNVYKIASTTRNGDVDWNAFLVRPNRLGYYGNGLTDNQLNGGIATFDNAYFWAKNGTGKGIYRFEGKDILSSDVVGTGNPPSLGAILTAYSIRAFAIDQINLKIYFSVTAPSDKIGFWVANLDGSNAQRIDDAPVDDPMLYITGIAIDNIANRVYWAYRSPAGLSAAYFNEHPTHRSGVKMAQLATTYKPAGAIEYFTPGVEVYGLVLDEVKK